jgi:DNA invertase Pin-like site-specific DNA recombinase
MRTDKIQSTHLAREAVVYLRQSSAAQVERNVESTARQYALVERAAEMGWPRTAVMVVDEDLGISGSGLKERPGFTRMAAAVAVGRVGIVMGLEVSRLARNNVDWSRLMEICRVTETLIADDDGIYDPADHNDRLLLGLKGTMAEAELHFLRARLTGGIRNKAARGELRRGLPIGLVWGEEDGEVLLDPDERVRRALQTVFERFADLGSVRQVWMWMRGEGLLVPTRRFPRGEITWVAPTYTRIHLTLTNPFYAGAYIYGKTKRERTVDASGRVQQRTRRVGQDQWQVFLRDHHVGYVNWDTYEGNRARITQNTHPRPHEGGGAIREGSAVLQGLATCGKCGRRLRVAYLGRNASPSYYCASTTLAGGRGLRCMSVGGRQIEQAVIKAFLAALTPAGIQAAVLAAEQLEANYEKALEPWRLAVERARYEAERAERRYKAVEPENRLVVRGLETEWETKLAALGRAEEEVAGRERRRPHRLTPEERQALLSLGNDLELVWSAPTTTYKDRKELLRSLLSEVVLRIREDKTQAQITMRWQGGATNELEMRLAAKRQPTIKTAEDTVDLLKRLAVHYPDAQIAGILNRQGRLSARGERFTASIVGSLRNNRGIARHHPTENLPDGELVTVQGAAAELGLNTSTVHRWLNDGFIAGEQLTPGAPWRIRLNDDLRALVTDQAPPGWVGMIEATIALGVSRQTVLQRVKRGELRALLLRSGRRKGLRIELAAAPDEPFDGLFSPIH